MDLTEDTLAARMALASIGRPGFGAGAQWLGRSTERSGWPIAKKTDYMQPKTIGSNWIRDGRGNVQVMHGSRNVADILDPGFNRTGGYVMPHLIQMLVTVYYTVCLLVQIRFHNL